MTFDSTSLRFNNDGKTVGFIIVGGSIMWDDQRGSCYVASLPLPDALSLHAALGQLLQVAASEQKPQSDIDARAEQAKEAETKI